MDEEQQVAKVLYNTMITAHKEQFGEASVKVRHYLQGQATELTTRMGLKRAFYARPEAHQRR